jgi:hypothetical protein
MTTSHNEIKHTVAIVNFSAQLSSHHLMYQTADDGLLETMKSIVEVGRTVVMVRRLRPLLSVVAWPVAEPVSPGQL